MRDGVDIDAVDMATAFDLIESLMVDSLPQDGRLHQMDRLRSWLYSPLVITADDWGTSPEAAAAAAALEAMSPPATAR